MDYMQPHGFFESRMLPLFFSVQSVRKRVRAHVAAADLGD
jgi:ornithine carbamoyltransferase